ncbi:MAG: hypothetical protein GXO74_13565 [Calditrichaeota bacterium]|nr:hypothetical protein [Calditrichota bacterium]
MDPISFSKIVSSLEIEKALNNTTQKTFSNALSSIYDYVRFKIDPWGRITYKKKLIAALKDKQIEFLSNSIAKINELKIAEINNLQTEEKILTETLKYLQNPVFIEFVKNITKPSFNWKGGSRKKEKAFYNEEAWWDKFCELMNKRHEEWRAKLFAEALKIQASGQGYVGYTTLWKIASLPPHSWIDLTQYMSLAGQIWVNGEFKFTVIPGAFSKISQLDYSIGNGERRLLSDLETSLTEDNLTRQETGPIVLKKSDDNKFILNDIEYSFVVDPNYEDPLLTDEDLDKDSKFLKNYFRFYGIWLSYIGEEIIQLSSDDAVHEEAEILFNKCKVDLEQDGILFIKSK